jgi:hypothetical protein
VKRSRSTGLQAACAACDGLLDALWRTLGPEEYAAFIHYVRGRLEAEERRPDVAFWLRRMDR